MQDLDDRNQDSAVKREYERKLHEASHALQVHAARAHAPDGRHANADVVMY